jgi:phosphoribosylanthranilate isomerase
MVKIKICGITTLEDALAALEAGADMLGFNFYPSSPRYIDPLSCTKIRSGLDERGLKAATIGVFVNAAPLTIAGILDDCGLDLAQLSGDEPPETLKELDSRAFKALRPNSQTGLAKALQVYPARQAPPAWLVDAYHPGQYGGTGRRADWSLASGLARKAPVLLAGGLRPENVSAAIRQVRPWGVDVASGVESLPGRKDPYKLAAFVSAVRNSVQEESRVSFE